MQRTALIILISIFSISIFAQKIKYEDYIYDANILSVLFHRMEGQLAVPYIRLGSNDKLRLAFDDMSNETYLFKYTIIHCDYKWQPTGLEQFEYLDGFTEGEIRDFEFSFNAIPGYIHYEHVFPERQINIKLSGNYLLKVYVNDPSDENVVFTRRFYVIEPMARIDVTVPYYPKRLEYTRYKQQIDLRVFTPDLFSTEPERRINVNIQQNGRWDNAKIGLKPVAITTNMLDYTYPEGIVFDGGNEFREFNIESYWYRSMYINQILNEKDGVRVILHTTAPRAGRPYETLMDINGMRVIQARKEQNTSIEGEYAWVEFTLKASEFEDADVYILGQLNDWQLDDRSRMRYDSRSRMYYGQLYLKQGFYNYHYVVVPKGKKMGDVTLIEGDHWETANDYTIYVYYRERVPEYDRLVGYLTINSREAKR
jgi:hypothetical protein